MKKTDNSILAKQTGTLAMNPIFRLICIFILCFFFAGTAVADVPGPEFTSETTECRFTPELTALAEDLDHDAVKIFKWVYENIESPKLMYKDGTSIKFRPFYEKSRLGAHTTYLAGRGNHWDTSSLLITLLRISGIPARYAQYSGTGYVWVEAWIKHGNYRNGSGVDSTGQWIPMVPWFKAYEVEPGLDLFTGSTVPAGLDFDFESYLLTDNPKHAAELYEEKLQDYLATHHPGQTLQSIAYQETTKDYDLSILSPTLPVDMRLSASIITFAEVASSDRVSITIKFKNKDTDADLLTYTAVMPEVSGKRICLDFKNVSGILKPVIKVDGTIVQGGETSDPGLNASGKFYISYMGGGYDSWVDRPAMDAGTLVHIGLDPVAASPVTVARLKEEYSSIDPALISDPDNREQLLGRMGKILSETYLSRNFDIKRRMDNLVHGRTAWNALAPTFIFADPDNIATAGESKFWFHPQWNIDAQSKTGYYKRQDDQLESMAWDHPVHELARWLAGYASSYNEGLIFDDWQDTPSASTIKILMVANEDSSIDVGNRMTTADISTLEALKDDYGTVSNALYPSTIDFMIDRLNEGGIVTAPLRKVTHEGMTGYVMLVTNSNGNIGDSYLFNMFEGGKTGESVVPSVTTVPSDSFHDTSTSISPAAQQTVADTYVNPDSDTTTASNDSWFSRALSTAGDPVDMATGEFYHEELPDIIIPSRGLNLSIVRTYKSRLIYNGPFGYGWTWNHAQHIIPQQSGDLIYYDENSQPQTLVDNGDGTYQTAPGVTYAVRKEGSEYIVKFRNNLEFTFNSDGFLTRKQDAYGNYLSFGYDTGNPGRIISIADALGQSLNLTYNAGGKVERLEDHTGRFCTYTYDGDDLTGFTDLENNTTAFAYLKNQSNPENNHNLTRYTLPEGDYLDIGYYENDQVSFHRNRREDTFHFFYSTLNRYGETWNEEGYYRKVFFNENQDEIRVLHEDGTVVQKAYDQYHNLTSLIDGNGNETVFDYGADPSKRLLASKTDSLNHVTSYAYTDTNNPYRPSQITDPKSHVTKLSYYPSGRLHTKTTGVDQAYDTDGRLVESPGAPGFTTTFAYDGFGNLVRITDPLNNGILHAYDENGLRKLSTTDKNGHVTAFDYYEQGDGQPLGLLQSRTIVSSLHPEGITTRYEYNQYNQVTLVTDPAGNQTVQDYDANRKPTVTTRPNGAVTQNIYDWARDLVAGAKVKETIDPLGNSTLFIHDRLGNVISVTDSEGYTRDADYNGRSRLTRRTDETGNTEYFEYDGMGNITAHTDKRGHDTGYTYDDAGRLLTVTDPEGNVTTTTWDAAGNKETVTDPNLNVTTFTYDALNRLVSKTTGFDTPDARTTEYRYDELNRLVKEISPEGHYRTFAYDAKANLRFTVFYDASDVRIKQIETIYYSDARDLVYTTIVDHGKDGSETGIVYEYDKKGRKIAETDEAGNTVRYEYDSVGNLLSTATPLGISENYYDLAGRLVTTITPSGDQTHYQYDTKGNLTWTRDPDGHETRMAYNGLGRQVATLDALNHTVLYDYDENANVLAVTDPENQTTYYTYDKANRKTGTTRPMGQEVSFAYDEAGNLAEIINGEGHKTAYTYNSLNQPRQVSYYNQSDLFTPVKTVLFSYDANGNMAGYDDAVTSAVFQYDGLDRKTSTTVDFGAFTKTFANAYPDNWTRTFTGPDAQATTFEYDGSGRLITAGSVQYGDYLWDLPQTQSTSGSTTRYGYDLNGRIVSVTAQNSAQATLLDRQYTYSPGGNLDTLDTEHGTYAYTHDELSRITGVDAPAGLEDEAYTYDGAGNRLTSLATASPWQYNPNNELTGQGAASYTYDDNGSITRRTGSEPLSFIYDESGRMTEVRDAADAVIATYYYDPFGRRLSKNVNGVRTYYLYADEGLIAEYDSTGTEIRSYGYLPGTANSIAPLYTKENSQYYWYHNDHIGTPQQLVDDTGTLAWEARYTSFGKAALVTETITNNFRLPGHYYDEETGLHYNGNRYYDPDTGRYLRTDPLGIEGGMNLYVYAMNSPLMFTDPDGLIARDAWDYTKRSGDQLIRGNYSDEVTLLGTGAQIGTGLLGLDLPGDIRDITYDLTNWEWSWGHAGQTLLDTASLLPLVGALKYADETSTLIKNVDKVDEIADTAKNTSKGGIDFVVTESGVAIPKNPKTLKNNLDTAFQDVSTNSSTSRKFVGEDAQGPLRVRIEKAHPIDPNFTGTPDPLHTVDHMHLDRRKNVTSGGWKSKEKIDYDWPF
nr:RHS repeat-associated core domain-containing protein [uncultured Desulfobacter sp.]